LFGGFLWYPYEVFCFFLYDTDTISTNTGAITSVTTSNTTITTTTAAAAVFSLLFQEIVTQI
jgi:hypothetical protein